MITQEQIEIARKQFVRASESLDFELESPFVIDPKTNLVAFAYLPDYGSANGVIVDLTAAPEYRCDSRLIKWCKENQVFYSCLNIVPLLNTFDKRYFRELLQDWKL